MKPSALPMSLKLGIYQREMNSLPIATFDTSLPNRHVIVHKTSQMCYACAGKSQPQTPNSHLALLMIYLELVWSNHLRTAWSSGLFDADFANRAARHQMSTSRIHEPIISQHAPGVTRGGVFFSSFSARNIRGFFLFHFLFICGLRCSSLTRSGELYSRYISRWEMSAPSRSLTCQSGIAAA